jgi:anti-sigma regulatory factor (Ser/Thr protein kinase)
VSYRHHVRIYFPNSGHLANFGGFARRQDPSDPTFIDFTMHASYVSVHPVVVSMAAAAAQLVRDGNGKVTADFAGSDRSVRYLARMKLTDFLGIDPGLPLTKHAPEGRFIPVTQIRDQAGLNEFIVDMVPLLHADPEVAGPIKFVVTELVRNVLEHSRSRVGAMVCAQYYRKTERLAVGVADMGIGIRRSISQSHKPSSDLDAIHLSLRPGVTGATTRLGGNEENAGAGLFLTKSIASASQNLFVLYSGSAMFKLLKTDGEQSVLLADPGADRATREESLPSWPGTAVGIDMSVSTHAQFSELLAEIRQAYHLDVRDRKKAKYRRPRFR